MRYLIIFVSILLLAVSAPSVAGENNTANGVITPLKDEDAETIILILRSGFRIYHEQLEQGGHQMAAAEALLEVRRHPFVKEAGISGSGSIWVEFQNGVSGVIPLHLPGTR